MWRELYILNNYGLNTEQAHALGEQTSDSTGMDYNQRLEPKQRHMEGKEQKTQNAVADWNLLHYQSSFFFFYNLYRFVCLAYLHLFPSKGILGKG